MVPREGNVFDILEMAAIETLRIPLFQLAVFSPLSRE